MLDKLKGIDGFGRNIIVVLSGSTLLNVSNLLYQLLIAHALSPSDFAGVNSLLSVLLILSMSQGAIQVSLAKYTAEFNAQGLNKKIGFLFAGLLKKTFFFAFLTLIIFSLASSHITSWLKIDSFSSGFILAMLLALSWVVPVFFGSLQGLELFSWLTSIQVIAGILKLVLAFLFILLGFNVSGALGALLIANLATLAISYFPLRSHLTFGPDKQDFDFKDFFIFVVPVAVSTFCFFALVSSDLILVKLFFNKEEAGIYSIAQMVGKIFLFLPWAVSVVMFPKISGMNAKNLDTTAILYRSISYVAGLCIIAGLAYNIFPSLALKILTGKAFSESVFLGRLFGISMAFFTLLYVLISYFLSIKELRFIKYLVSFTVLQILAICLFHKNLTQVQLVLCINSIVLFFIHLGLVNLRRTALSVK